MAPTFFSMYKCDMIKITWEIHCAESNLRNIPRELFSSSGPTNITTKCELLRTP